ncbi:hypothetical protein [Bacillus smithii]|uniref:hypothetical protein n=1 Tax=Bacillus smithii TaxID=1479 RepID=UPI0022E6FD75|nr:hypothetical protein [Bacillus smithii]
MESNRFFKGIVLTTSLSILITGLAPVTATFAEEYDNTPVVNSNQNTTTPKSLLDYIYAEGQPTSVEDTRDFIQYASTTKEFKSYIGKDQEDAVHASGVVGASLKAIKAFGWICRVGGKSLKYAIKPLSPSKARLVDHYARQIAYVTERLNSATKGALVKALQAAGVPGKTAESLAEIILWLV